MKVYRWGYNLKCKVGWKKAINANRITLYIEDGKNR